MRCVPIWKCLTLPNPTHSTVSPTLAHSIPTLSHSSRSHRLKFSRGPGQGTMDRRDDADDYVVVDPLLEKGKGKWSKKAQDEKKRKTEWAGRARD